MGVILIAIGAAIVIPIIVGLAASACKDLTWYLIRSATKEERVMCLLLFGLFVAMAGVIVGAIGGEFK